MTKKFEPLEITLDGHDAVINKLNEEAKIFILSCECGAGGSGEQMVHAIREARAEHRRLFREHYPTSRSRTLPKKWNTA